MSAIREAEFEGYTHVHTSSGWVPLCRWNPPHELVMRLRLIGSKFLVTPEEKGHSRADELQLGRLPRPGIVRARFNNYMGLGVPGITSTTWEIIVAGLANAGLHEGEITRKEIELLAHGACEVSSLGISLKLKTVAEPMEAH